MRIVAIAFLLSFWICSAFAEETQTRLLRHPHYNNGRLIFTYMGDVWLRDGKRPARRLTAHTAADINPRFSPDGKWVAFSSNRTGNWDVFIMPSGGGQPEQLTFHTGSDTVVTWTPDSKFVVFRSGRDSRRGGQPSGSCLYKVSTEGALPEMLPMGVASYGTFSGDGRFLAYNRRSPSFSRKRYRGSIDTELYLYDFESKKISRLTRNDWNDNSPMIAGKDVLFASPQYGTYNIWRMPLEGGRPVQVTRHKGEGVWYPSLSSDATTVVYEQGFGIWKLDLESGEYSKIDIELRTDYRENPVEHRNYSSVVEEYSVSPDGKRVAIAVHGEIFTVPLKKGKVVRITNSTARDWHPVYGPNGEKIAFVSDVSGREEVYVADADGSNHRQITDSDTLKLQTAWSPDAKLLAVAQSDHTLQIYDLESAKGRTLFKHEVADVHSIRWSADGRWLAYLATNKDRWWDVFLISAVDENPVQHPVSYRLPYDETAVFITKEKVFFLGNSTDSGDPELYCASLKKQDVDPDDPEAREKRKKEEKKKKEEDKKKEEEKAKTDGGEKKEEDKKEKDEKKEKEPPEIQVDIEGIQKRVKKILSMPGTIRRLAVAPDSSVALVVREPRGKSQVDIIYSVSADGKKLKEIGKGGSISFSPDAKLLFYLSGKRLYHMSASGGSAKRVSFRVKVKIDRFAQYSQIFNECWRAMKHMFYDPNMHGLDWDATREKYAALLTSVTDKEALGHVVNRMLGELNASHSGMGSYQSPYSVKATYESRYPGFELTPDEESGRYRVKHIYEDGPADKEWVDIKVGDYIFSIDGKQLRAPENYWKILNHPRNNRVDVVVSSDPQASQKRTNTISLIGWWDLWYLRYDEWARATRKKVDELSGGRIAYLHIHSMGTSSLARFKREVVEFRRKEGLVVDVRYNGGGHVSGQIIDVLERKPNHIGIHRDSVPLLYPGNGFYGKKIVLQNERSFSDAEIFPSAFRDCGLGKLVGTPTPGFIIGMGSYRLIDSSRIIKPYIGVYSMDATNLENTGVFPDIYIENTPEDELSGHDAQLEAAVAELLKEIEQEK